MLKDPSGLTLALLIASLPATTLLADRVTLSSGGSLEGEVVGETPRALILKSAQGVLEIPRNQIAKIERSASYAPSAWMLPTPDPPEDLQAQAPPPPSADGSAPRPPPSPGKTDPEARLNATLACFERFESSPAAEKAANDLISLGKPLLPAILKRLKSLTPPQQKWLIDVLRLIGDPAAVEPLIGLMRSPSAEVRTASAQALASLKDPRAEDALIALLKDPDPAARRQACASLQALGRPEAIPPLIALLSDPVLPVRASARDALVALTGESLPVDPAAWTAWLAQHPPEEGPGEDSAGLKRGPGAEQAPEQEEEEDDEEGGGP